MLLSRLSYHMSGPTAALLFATGIVGASASSARANDATFYINNASGHTLSLDKYSTTNSDHSRITSIKTQIPPGYSGAFAAGNADFLYSMDPQTWYWVGNTGKSVRMSASQNIGRVDVICAFEDGKPAGASCGPYRVDSNILSPDYSVYFTLNGSARRVRSRSAHR